VKLACFAGLALASCAATKAPEAASEEHAFGLPPVRGALEFPADAHEVTLGWLVDELARLTGQELTMSSALRAQLDSETEPLEITAAVPAREVYAFVEAILAVQGVLIAPVKGGARPVLAVQGFADAGRPPGEILAVPIELGLVEALAGHPALVCQVMLVLENVDSRQLQTELRQLLSDESGVQQVVPAGDRGLLLRAPGAKLLGLVRALREVDRASAARPETEPAQPPNAPPEVPTAPRPAGE